MLMDSHKLGFKNPNGPVAAEHKTPQEILVEFEKTEHQISSLLGEIKKEI